jgi:adenosylcobinamide-GDP ribazoletransferase
MQGFFAYLLETAAGWGRDVRLALGFLTRIPVGETVDSRPLGVAARAFPLVGLAVGAAAALMLWIGTLFAWPPLLSALLALGLLALITGALHEDGLADTLDGLGHKGGPEEKLAVMRDSRIGTFGTLALVFSVGIRAAALSGMRGDMEAVFAVAAACVLARAALPAVMAIHPPARQDGLAYSAGRPDLDGVATAGALGVLLALLLVDFQAAVVAAAAAGTGALAMARLAAHRLGGITGDVIGAAEQAAQSSALLALAWALQ